MEKKKIKQRKIQRIKTKEKPYSTGFAEYGFKIINFDTQGILWYTKMDKNLSIIGIFRGDTSWINMNIN